MPDRAGAEVHRLGMERVSLWKGTPIVGSGYVKMEEAADPSPACRGVAAGPLGSQAVGVERREILVFEIDGRRFALPASSVRELVRAVAIVPLPMAPPIVEGVIDLRGQVVPVVDIRPRLGLEPRPVEPADHLIIARSRGRLVALRVDRALELVATAADGREPGAAGSPRVARLADGLAPILDPEALWTGPEAEALGALLGGPGVAAGARP
jgi:purine-binding chemotaxis protein CheW